MSIKYFNDGFGMSPEDYAKALFENTIDNKLTLSRRNEDPFSEEYDKQYFESYTMDWDRNDLEDVIDDFKALYSELVKTVKEFGTDYAVNFLELEYYDEIIAFRAKRLCKLIELGPPEIIINSEACKLMDAMIIARFAVSLDYMFRFADKINIV